ncbi:MAG: hypothetical protein JNK52_10095 [Zoogloeaceae bacterium]|nr:hypothetical protein [Zoogloeaceae bacterium]
MADRTLSTELAGQQAVELGELLARTVVSVAEAQESLDRHATARLDALEHDEPDAPRVPPLWYTFTEVSVEVALSMTVQHATTGTSTRLLTRPVDPRQVSLYGYQAASSLVVRLQLSPRSAPPDVEPTP